MLTKTDNDWVVIMNDTSCRYGDKYSLMGFLYLRCVNAPIDIEIMHFKR